MGKRSITARDSEQIKPLFDSAQRDSIFGMSGINYFSTTFQSLNNGVLISGQFAMTVQKILSL